MSTEVSLYELPSVQDLAPWYDDVADDEAEDGTDVLAAALASATAEGYTDGHTRGYADGLAEGRRAGLAEGRAAAMEAAAVEIGTAVAALHAAAADLAARDEAALDAITDDVADLVVGLVEELAGRRIEEDDDPARAAVHRALALAPDRGAVVARLHPDDLATTGLADDEELRSRGFELLADPTVEPGGAVVEVGACRVDAQLGAALARIRGVLRP